MRDYEAAEARPSLVMSKYHIVGNHMHWLNNKSETIRCVRQLIIEISHSKSWNHLAI